MTERAVYAGRAFRRCRWALLLPSLALCGCTAFITRQITHPGHHTQLGKAFGDILAGQGITHGELRTAEGVRIAYWLVPPRAYRVTEHIHRTVSAGKVTGFEFRFQFDSHGKTQPPRLPSEGSVLLLHPWGTDGLAMLPWALKYAEAGYVALVPDLRGQGDSSDAPVGYGPREAKDMVDLVGQLRAAGQLPGPLYAVGASYGATVALFAASGLPGLQGVLALEPYANAADTIRRAPASGLFGHHWLARWITPNEVDAAITLASRRLGVDLARIDVGDALAAGGACTLIVRGADDRLVSAEALRTASDRSSRASYIEVPGESHLSLPISVDRLLEPSLGWMRALAEGDGESCPAFVALPPVNDEPVTASPEARTPGSVPVPTASRAPAAHAPAAGQR